MKNARDDKCQMFNVQGKRVPWFVPAPRHIGIAIGGAAATYYVRMGGFYFWNCPRHTRSAIQLNIEDSTLIIWHSWHSWHSSFLALSIEHLALSIEPVKES